MGDGKRAGRLPEGKRPGPVMHSSVAENYGTL